MATEAKQVNLEERFEFDGKVKRPIFIILGLGLIFLVIGLTMAVLGGGHEGGHALIDAATNSLASTEAVDATNAEGHGYSWVQRVYANLWINNVFFTGLAIIGVFFFAIQYVANAGWSASIIRIMFSLGRFLPISFGLMIIVFAIAGHDLFHWTHESLYDKTSPDYDPIIAGKEGFLNPIFYWGRMIFFFCGWLLFAWFLRRESYKEDTLGGTKQFRKLVRISAAFLIFFGLSSSVSAWDWVMSIDTHWFSTMFGWYVFASWFVSGLSAITLLIILLKGWGYLQVVNENHLHDLGKFIFGFSIFWAYIWFSQFLLIYYANIPEETIYFIERLSSDYYSKIIFMNLVLNFIFPFLILMTRDAKRKTIILKLVCVIVLIGHWFDFYLMITPGTLKAHGTFGFLEIGMALIYLGVFAFVVFNGLAKKVLVPKNHPMIQESIYHHT